MKIGYKIRQEYPFQHVSTGFEESHIKHLNFKFWMAGCKANTEDGPAVFEGQCMPYNYFTCDKEGEIELEILSIAKMPGRYQDRVICKRTTIAPDGEIKVTGIITVTAGKMKSWIDGKRIFPTDYEVEDF